MIKQEPNEVYHAEREHFSSSYIHGFSRSPLYAKENLDNHSSTKEMDLGSAYHAIMEGTFSRDYITDEVIISTINSDRPRQTKAYKEWKAEQKKTIISKEDSEIIFSMTDILKKNSIVDKFLSSDRIQHREISIYGEIEGIPVKVRPDLLTETEKHMLIIDWKTITSSELSEKRLKWRINDMYSTAAPLYIKVVEQEFKKPTSFMFIFQEKTPPYDVLPVLWGSHDYDNQLIENLKAAQKCKEEQNYPGMAGKYSNGYFLFQHV